jgi:hypothetical protein
MASSTKVISKQAPAFCLTCLSVKLIRADVRECDLLRPVLPRFRRLVNHVKLHALASSIERFFFSKNGVLLLHSLTSHSRSHKSTQTQCSIHKKRLSEKHIMVKKAQSSDYASTQVRYKLLGRILQPCRHLRKEGAIVQALKRRP